MTRSPRHLLASRWSPALALACALTATPTWANDLGLGRLLGSASNLSKTQQVAQMTEADEAMVGRQIAEKTLGSFPVVHNEKSQRYVNQVGRWVALQSSRPNLPWRFAVVQSDQINAFAVPGGTVLVTTGMMNLLGNEAELACVLGHEIAHITHRHHVSVLEKAAALEVGSQLVADNLRGSNGIAKQWLLKEGTEVLSRSLDRDAEREADSEGALLAAKAGYDPGACVLFMERLASQKTDANALEALYKTHPQASERVVDITAASNRMDGASAGDGSRPRLLFR